MKSNKIIYSLSGVLLTSFGLNSCSNEQQEGKSNEVEPRPNILWIVADDLGADLGCYGNSIIHTPNLDKLASEGVKYTNFFTVTAVSSPSRSSLMTGMYPTSIESHQHRIQYKKALPIGIFPITKYFRNAGYFTSNGNYRNKNRPGKKDYNFIADSIFDGTDWSQRKEGQAFFAQIQINYPHRPFLRDSLNPINEKDVNLPPYYPDHRIARQDWAFYLETIQILDRKVGIVLERLKNEGLADNTVIFFFGDQGRPHVRAKQFLYDGGIRTPLIIKNKGKIDPGTICDDLVENLDIGPASLKIAGIKIPDYIQGNNFLGEEASKRQFIFSMRDRRDETVDRIRAIRSKDFKYIRNFYPERPYTQFNAYKKNSYPVHTLMQIMNKNGQLSAVQQLFMAPNRPEHELYDLKNDPWELNNLAYNTEFNAILVDFQDVLNQHLTEFDKALYPEHGDEINYATELMKKRFNNNMERKGLSIESTDEEILEYWEKYLDPTKK